MTAGGYRPNSGPMPGTKYRPRANKKEKVPKIPKKRGRPPKIKIEAVAPLVDTATMAVKEVVEKIPKTVKVKKTIISVAALPVDVVVVPVQEPIAPQPTSLVSTDIENAAAALNLTPLDYLLSVMNNPIEDQNIRIRVAGMIAPFIHPKPGERTGKKDEKEERAAVASKGKFSPSKQSLTLVK